MSEDLFGNIAPDPAKAGAVGGVLSDVTSGAPLAVRMRPRTLDEMVLTI